MIAGRKVHDTAGNNLMKIKGNIYDWILMILIASLAFGAIGGSIQVIRMISVILLPSNIYSFLTKRFSKRIFRYYIFGFFWLLYAVFSINWSKDTTEAKINVLFLLIHFNIVYSIIRFGMRSVNPLRAVVYGWLGFLIFTLPLALSEILSGHHLSTNSIQTEMAEAGILLNGVENKRYAAATFNNYNEYMTALSFSLPYLLGALLMFVDNKRQLFGWFMVFIYFIVVVISASRGALLTLVLCLLLFFIFYRKTQYKNKRLIMSAIAVLGIAGMAVFGNSLFEELFARLENTQMLEDVGRLTIYLTAWDLFTASHYWGIGADGFEGIMGFAPHNLWLEVLGQYGIIVFLFFVVALLGAIVSAVKSSSVNSTFRAIAIMSFLSLPIISIINSAYLKFPFYWVSIGSILLLTEYYINIRTNSHDKMKLK